jgi:phosphoenolpyruvate carboxylase
MGVGRNLLYRTGSRRVSREAAGGRPFHERRTAQMRAIPHNGVLQQLGYLANNVGGIGAAIAKDQDRFAEVLAGSPRCRGIMSLAAYAFTLSSLDAFAAYANLFDPASWLARARHESDEGRRRVLQRVARRIAATGWHEGPRRVARNLIDDAVDFRAALDALGDVQLVPAVADDCHPDLELLHVVRIALIQRLFLLAARLPRFTPQEGVTIDEVIEQILSLDVPTAVAALKETFPADGRVLRADAFGEPASYEAVGRHSYDEEHHDLFDPMLRLHELARRVSVCISHVMGAVG